MLLKTIITIRQKGHVNYDIYYKFIYKPTQVNMRVQTCRISQENVFIIDSQGLMSHEYFPDEHICNTENVYFALHTLS